MKIRSLTRVTALLALSLMVTGCVFVGPQEKVLISSQASNARVFSEKLEAESNVPEYVKTWVKGEANSWTALEAWSQGKRATSPSN